MIGEKVGIFRVDECGDEMMMLASKYKVSMEDKVFMNVCRSNRNRWKMAIARLTEGP